MELVWISVKDFKAAIKFYTEVIGLKLIEKNDEWGLAELVGQDGKGLRLGIAKEDLKGQDPVKPGQNAVLTIVVDNIDKSSKELIAKGIKLIGSMQEVPGQVKLQTARDLDGNYFQLVEKLS